MVYSHYKLETDVIMPWVKSNREKFLKEYPHLKDFLPFLDIQNSESPRGKVLVACSFLEEQLKNIIEAYLIEGSDIKLLLEGFNAPLGSFSARIKAAHCLGLISDTEYSDCNIFRKIRNEFAHNHNVSFEDTKFKNLCANLHHSAKDYGDVVVDAQGQFTTGSVALISNLVNRPHYVAQKRLRKKDWPR